MTSGELILYTVGDGSVQIQLRAPEGTVWLSQLEMAALFDTTKQNISLHIKNILAEGELPAGSTVKESLTVQAEGKRPVRRSNRLYNLDRTQLAANADAMDALDQAVGALEGKGRGNKK